jgi:hypothetical protein
MKLAAAGDDAQQGAPHQMQRKTKSLETIFTVHVFGVCPETINLN